jgi:hypothetical protein
VGATARPLGHPQGALCFSGGVSRVASIAPEAAGAAKDHSLTEISAELAQRGIFNERGVQFSAPSICSMLR